MAARCCKLFCIRVEQEWYFTCYAPRPQSKRYAFSLRSKARSVCNTGYAVSVYAYKCGYSGRTAHLRADAIHLLSSCDDLTRKCNNQESNERQDRVSFVCAASKPRKRNRYGCVACYVECIACGYGSNKYRY